VAHHLLVRVEELASEPLDRPSLRIAAWSSLNVRGSADISSLTAGAPTKVAVLD